MSFEWDASSFFTHIENKSKSVQDVAEQRLGDAVDDLARIATNLAPIGDTGNLRRTVKKSIKGKFGAVSGEVSFSAVENSPGYGRFNYALWTHEYMGENQVSQPGSSDGYTVGPKYLQRPLEGERNRYLRQIAEGVKGVLD